jgi:hypothetical protein
MSYQEQGGGSESVVVNGTVEGVEIKPNGRFVVKVREIGSSSQYSLNLNTKDQGLANQMMNAIGQQFSFVCGLSHWTNQQNQAVTSKWINGVAPLQAGMVQQPQQQVQQQQFQGQPQQQFAGQQAAVPFTPQQQAPAPQRQEQTDDAFIRRVSFLAALEPAVAMLAYLPAEQHGVPALVKMADFFARTAILRGQQGFGQQNGTSTGYQQQQAQPQPQQFGGSEDEYGTPPPGDDDIPF